MKNRDKISFLTNDMCFLDEPYSPGDSSPDAPVLTEQPPPVILPPSLQPALPPVLTPALGSSSLPESPLAPTPFTALPGKC